MKVSDFYYLPILSAEMLGSVNEQLQKNATWKNKLKKNLDFFFKHKEDLAYNFLSH